MVAGRFARAGLTAVVALFGLALGASPSHGLEADFPSPCTHANFQAPARVTVATQWTNVQNPLDNDCTSPYLSEKFSAKWRAVAENGAVVDEVSYHTLGNPNDWDEDPAINVEDSVHLGRWSWHPYAGFTDVDLPHHDETLTLAEMNSPTSDVRVGSSATASAVRSGSKVTISTRSMRYWTSTHAFGIWTRAVGIIQYRVPGTTTWYNLKNVAGDAAGRYAYTYTISARRDYRVVFFDTAPYIWGSSSAKVATA